MIKKTLYFGNPAYLSLRNKQLVIKTPGIEKAKNSSEAFKEMMTQTIPIEDIGVVVLDCREMTLTQGLLAALLENNTAVITCNSQRMPVGMLLALQGNKTQNERFRQQLDASKPLMKQLWQQTVREKILNQAALLKTIPGENAARLLRLADEVRSGDNTNCEAQAAVYYWRNIFPTLPNFVRGQEEAPPNNLLNYGYAILRAVIARALVASGLLPVHGIHHHNRYNDYCLADDIMEPYRPFVDKLVIEVMERMEVPEKLTTELKGEMLSVPVLDVKISGKRSPLMVAAAQTAASLAKCFSGEARKIAYPSFME